jgi:farnesol dehydrogenase
MSSLTTPTTIFVTGGTGFIGTKLVNALVAKGHTVRCLSRSTSNREGLTHERISFVPGSVFDNDSLRKGMEGCTQVYHLAAFVKNWAQDPQEFFRQNVNGMQNVFDAAKAANIQRIVFTSTIVTMGPSRPGEVRDESMPRITPRYYTEYEESKAVAEGMALEQAKAGLPVVIVNPTRVYGPGKMTEGNSVSIMIDMYDRWKLPVLLNGGRDVGNYVFVDDLVRGFILAMERGRIGERYILGGENASLKRFFELVKEVTGRPRPQFSLPPRIAYAFSWIEKKKADWLGIYPQITPGWVETFLMDWAYHCAKAERELGYQITPLKEGIRMTWEWLLEQRKKR